MSRIEFEEDGITYRSKNDKKAIVSSLDGGLER